MELIAKLIYNLLHSVKTFNKLSKSSNIDGFYQPYFNISINSPYGKGVSEKDKIEGLHFDLTIVLEPISEECEVLNNIVSFIITDDEIKNIIFNENGIEHLKNDLKRNQQNCDILLNDIRGYCEKFIGNKKEK